MPNLSIRNFIIDSKDEVFKLSRTKCDAIWNQELMLPRNFLSERKVRSAETVVIMENRKPIKVVRFSYNYMLFNDDGLFLKQQSFESMVKATLFGAIEVGSPKIKITKNVIDANPFFSKLKDRNEAKWKPSGTMNIQIEKASLGLLKCKRL